jgi:rhodanese-related sulfurtransferase
VTAAATPRLEARAADALIRTGEAVLVDVRAAGLHGEAHVPGSRAVAYVREGFVERVRQQVPEPSALVVLAADPFVGGLAAAALTAGGYSVRGMLVGLDEWREAGLPLMTVPQAAPDALAATGPWTVVDVREPEEWRSGTIPGALRIPLGLLADQLPSLPATARYAVVCAHGNRSQRGAALLLGAGREAVSVVGGMALWLQRGLPVER